MTITRFTRLPLQTSIKLRHIPAIPIAERPPIHKPQKVELTQQEINDGWRFLHIDEVHRRKRPILGLRVYMHWANEWSHTSYFEGADNHTTYSTKLPYPIP